VFGHGKLIVKFVVVEFECVNNFGYLLFFVMGFHFEEDVFDMRFLVGEGEEGDFEYEEGFCSCC
jgi:hypothetical protein